MTDALAAQAPVWTPGDGHGYHGVTFGHLVGEASLDALALPLLGHGGPDGVYAARTFRR